MNAEQPDETILCTKCPTPHQYARFNRGIELPDCLAFLKSRERRGDQDARLKRERFWSALGKAKKKEATAQATPPSFGSTVMRAPAER